MMLLTSTFREYVEELTGNFERDMANRPEEWIISDRLSEKVTPDGKMNPFFGATSVIKLSEEDRGKCWRIQQELWEHHGNMLVELLPETYHLTIHAFSNVYNVSQNIDEIRAEMESLEGRIGEEMLRVGEIYGDTVIRMRALGTRTGGKDAVSINFVPAEERDFQVLADLYNRFETIYPLGNPFIPHVSLSYFKVKKFGREEFHRLYDTLDRLNAGTKFDILLDVRNFVYQHHYHMNDFRDMLGIFPQQEN